MSQQQTSQQSEHKHISKMLKDELRTSEDGKKVYWVTTLYGCTGCDATSEEGWFNQEDDEPIDHTRCGGPDVCFGCKVRTLQLNAGDATRDIPDKKWTAELNEYKKARAEGLRPAGTTYAHIEQARTASETLGTAYNAETMPKAKHITKKTAEVMKEIGQI